MFINGTYHIIVCVQFLIINPIVKHFTQKTDLNVELKDYMLFASSNQIQLRFKN